MIKQVNKSLSPITINWAFDYVVELLDKSNIPLKVVHAHAYNHNYYNIQCYSAI